MTEKPIALVTGAGKGIGRAIALELATQGYAVALVGRHEATLSDVVAEVRAQHGEAASFVCDIRSSQEVEAICARVQREMGEIEVLVNNAGVAPSATLFDTTNEMWSNTLATNVSGAFYLARAFAPAMKARKRGDILSIASTAALRGFSYNSAYTASKHALLGLTRALAVELARYNIRVNAICPGFVRTDILEAAIENVTGRTGKSREEAEATLAHMNEGGKMIEPEDVARLVTRTIQQTEFVTGKAILMDGMLID